MEKGLVHVLRADLARRRKATWKQMKKSKISFLFIAPYCIIFTVFYLVPVVTSIGLSFTYYNVLESPRFIGWQNYINLFFADDVFLTAVKNTFLFAVVTGPVGYFMALIIAWMINEIKRPVLRAIMTLVFYAPTISGQAYFIWKFIFSSDSYGFANGWLMKLGATYSPILWFEDGKYIQPILIVVVLWMSMGTGFLSFIAGLQNVDRSLYEAGYMDGITSSFAIHDQLAALAGFPSVGYAAHTVVSHLVDYGTIRFEMGYASAIATLLFMVMILCNKLVQFLLRKVGQ